MTPNNAARRILYAFGIAVFLTAVLPLEAIYIGPDIENVPIERLIRNLEQLVSNNPKDSAIRFNLARAHAMAFARKLTPSQTVPIVRGRDAQGIWFGTAGGPESEFVPFRTVPTSDAAIQTLAAEYLAKAIELYRQGIELDPSNLAAKLGYAWCLDQSGDTAKAITAYRHVISQGWVAEQGAIRPVSRVAGGAVRVSAGPGFRSITTEAAGYLIPLLDRERDRDEIATLQERIQAVNSMGRGVTPIVIPLREDLKVSEMIDDSARVPFDADGSGIKRRWTWITSNAGWLVHAPKGSRPITSALQLFGNVTFWMFWDNGYQALRALDDNADGQLAGAELEGLAIWQDSNSNGVAEHGEVKTLAEWEIRALSWKHESTPTREDYAAFSSAGVIFEDGRTRPTYDILLYAHERAVTETE